MTNPNAPFGLRPSRHLTGTGHRLNKYPIASGLAENIAIGDLVKSDGNGNIAKAAAGDAFLGVYMGHNYKYSGDGLSAASFAGSANGDIPFFKAWVSGTTPPTGVEVEALVADDPFETFEVQTSVAVTAADIGALVNLVDAAPDLTNGHSKQTVDKTGTPSQFRVQRILQKPVRLVDANNNTTGFGMSTTGNYALIEVTCMKHERGGAAMGVAV